MSEIPGMSPVKLAHLIHDATNPYRVVEMARRSGTALTALCGTEFVPTYRNPEEFPRCEQCVEILLRQAVLITSTVPDVMPGAES